MTARREIFWGYAAQALNLTAALILLPAVVRFLSPDEVGLWFVFVTLAGLAQLLEFGFQPTIARNAAYVHEGVGALEATGLPQAHGGDEAPPHASMLGDLIAASRHIYRWVAGFAAAVLLLGGSAYIVTLLTTNLDAKPVMLAWVLFASGYVVQFYFGYLNGLLQGRGDVTLANKAVIASRASLIIGGSIALALGWGLAGLGAASLLSCAVGRWLSMRFYGRLPDSDPERKAETRAVVRTLWHNASRLGTVQLGAFMILRANVLIASSFLGLAEGASYALTLTLLTALTGIASTILQVQLPRMNMLQIQRQQHELREIYSGAVVIAWSLFAIGAAILIFLGPIVLPAIGSRTSLLPPAALVILSAAMALEMNHSIAAGYLTTTNQIDFVASAMISGIAIVALALGLISWLGLWALIGSQTIVQLCYNNWHWPRRAMGELGLSVRSLLVLGMRRSLALLSGRPA